MSNTFIDPVYVKSQPHASAEKMVGDADPNGRTDVENRVVKGLWAKLQQLANTLLDLAPIDATDQATTAALAASSVSVLKLTNSASGSTAAGDVLAVSSQTAILGDTVGSLQKFVVAGGVIANGSAGRFIAAGPVSAKSQGTIAAMQYVKKSATARAVEDAGVAVGATTAPPPGAVGFAMAAAAGDFCTVLLFPETIGSGVRLLDADTAEAEAVNTTDETTVYTKTIPAGTLGTTRALRVTMLGDILNNTGSGVVLTVRVKLGATTVLSYAPSITSGAGRLGQNLSVVIAAAGATNAQRAAGEVHITSSAAGSMGGALLTLVGLHNSVAEDTTSDKTLAITYQWASASANASAKCFTVHVELVG